MRKWLIKKLIGNKPVIANVSLKLSDGIMASEPEVLFHQSYVGYDVEVEDIEATN